MPKPKTRLEKAERLIETMISDLEEFRLDLWDAITPEEAERVSDLCDSLSSEALDTGSAILIALAEQAEQSPEGESK